MESYYWRLSLDFEQRRIIGQIKCVHAPKIEKYLGIRNNNDFDVGPDSNRYWVLGVSPDSYRDWVLVGISEERIITLYTLIITQFLSIVHCPLSTVHCPLSIVCRPKILSTFAPNIKTESSWKS